MKPAENSETKEGQNEINPGSPNEMPTQGKKEQDSKTTRDH